MAEASHTHHIHVYVIEDQPAIVQGLSYILKYTPDIEMIGWQEDHHAGRIRSILLKHNIDVVIADLNIKGNSANGIQLIDLINKEFQDVKILVFSAYPQLLPSIFKKGLQIYGFLNKHETYEDTLKEAIRTISKGEKYFPPPIKGIIQKIMAIKYTQREKEVLWLSALGYTAEESANILNIEPDTARDHGKKIKAKTPELKNIISIVVHAICMGHLDWPKLKEFYHHPSPKSSPSEQELRVLRLIAEGKTNSEIGEALFIAPNTVQAHRQSLIKKFDVSKSIQVVILALKFNFLSLDELTKFYQNQKT